ncbi:sugar diacid recognition domain-containing protein [Shewanella sp. GXUN23E]|uniref:sugar diacid recognition domain-containing protein n=1 Tax=Shewanella sp. GXUN23E TaxID=3422498 RepID=UPI003D7CF679
MLSKSIAQKIVERVMSALNYSINVIDQNGIIIGSGDASRINDIHEGAQLAFNDCRTVEINDSIANQLKGVKPGINVPIFYGNNPVGIVGISGDPAEIREQVPLVKSIAELIIEQAEAMSHVQWDRRHREELVFQLINGDGFNEEQLTDIAERLKLDLKQPRIATIIKLFPKNGHQITSEHLVRLVYLLENPERDNIVAIKSVTRREVVVLKPVKLCNDSWSKEHELTRIKALFARIEDDKKYAAKIYLGDYYPNINGLSLSYLSAKATMQVNENISSKKGNEFHFYNDAIIPISLHYLKDIKWHSDRIAKPYQLLLAQDKKGLLRDTLKIYYQQNCNINATCDALQLHRNTIRYRLEKICEITKLNIFDFDANVLLYMSLQAHEGPSA